MHRQPSRELPLLPLRARPARSPVPVDVSAQRSGGSAARLVDERDLGEHTRG